MVLTLISDFNISVLGRYLANMDEMAGVNVDVAPYGQVFQQLLTPPGDEQQQRAVLVWTRPESVLESFSDVLRYKPVSHDEVLDELDRYIDALRSRAAGVAFLFHPSWVTPVGERGYGMLDYSYGLGLSSLLARLNLRLSERLADLPNVFILNSEHWVRAAGSRPALAKMWFVNKVPYSNAVFQEAASDIAAALQGLAGKARKLIILDLDNTLWGGVVGETGWQGVKLGGHDHVGEAFVHFQQRLLALSERGIQLGIVSKNDEAVALEAIDRHPEMLLRRSNFAGWRINWSDKAQNIVDLVSELQLGLDSVVFVDDNPAERDRVRDSLGDQVMVPEWPVDPAEYGNALSALKCFDTPSLSSEDRARAGMYTSERERRESRQDVGSLDSWLASLEMKVSVEALTAGNLPRAAQLLNKTNQMNMRTRRLSEQELQDWVDGENCQLWTFRLSDRFGDSGLSGLISVEIKQGTAHIVDFVMSCRVMGRKLEEVMIHTVMEYIKKKGKPMQILAEYIETPRNHPCLEFWENSGFDQRESNRFFRDTTESYPKPDLIEVLDVGVPE